MKTIVILLILVVPVLAGDYIETTDGLTAVDVVDSCLVVKAGHNLVGVLGRSSGRGDWSWDGLGDAVIDTAVVAHNVDWGSILNPSTLKTHYVVSVDTGYVFLRRECDTTRMTIFEGDDTKPTEVRMDLDNCDNIYRYQIDTVWAELITFKGTPDEIKKLKELLQ